MVPIKRDHFTLLYCHKLTWKLVVKHREYFAQRLHPESLLKGGFEWPEANFHGLV